MICRFYTFNKRKNSTLRPTGDGTPYTITFKEPTNLRLPTIEVVGNVLPFNYCFIDFTWRYYWIREIRSISLNTYEIDLECDVLGTFGSAVIGQNVYATMSSYSYNTELDDSRIVPTNNLTISDIDYTLPIFDSNGHFFISIINDHGLLNGIDLFYDSINFLELVSDLNWWQQLRIDAFNVNPFDCVNEMYSTLLDPTQCHAVATNSGTVLGVSVSGSCIASPQVVHHRTSLSIPKPSVNDFRFTEKYVKYYLTIPYTGVITIPTYLARKFNTLQLSFSGDCLSGQFSISPYFISGSDELTLGVYGTSLKAPISLARQDNISGQIVTNGTIGAITSALAGAKIGGWQGAVGGAIGGAIGGAVKGAITPVDIDKLTSTTNAMAISGLNNMANVRLTMVESESDISPSNLVSISGRPTEKVIAIANGYIQTVNASVQFNGLSSEIEQFNTLLNGGVYFE